jgi:ATP-binding cassette subfamily C protein
VAATVASGKPREGMSDILRDEISAGVRLAVILGFLGAFGPFSTYALLATVFHQVLPTGSLETLYGLISGFAVLAAMLIALDHIRSLALIGISNRIARKLAVPVMQAAATRPGADSGRVANYALNDIDEVRRGVSGPLCTLALDMATLPIIMLLLTYFHWAFLLFAGFFALIALVLGILSDRLMRATLAEYNAETGQANLMVADGVRCAEAVVAMGLLPAIVRSWAGNLARGSQHLQKAQRTSYIVTAVTMTLFGLSHAGAMTVGVLLILSGENIGVGLIVCSMLTARLMSPFGQLGALLTDAAMARAAWYRLDRLLKDAPAQNLQFRSWPCTEGRLSVERLTFVHPGSTRPVIREVSFAVGPGELVAVAGPPGAGKSTLLRLLVGIERPTSGRVFLDGHSTYQWDREDLARHLAYMPQDPIVAGGTVAGVISRLNAAPDMPEVLRAARLAGAERMIAALPDGFATELDGAVRLSMGQRQRIALARAVYGSPRVILLDEPAAYLDAEGEAAVIQLLNDLKAAGIAVIFTSHREALVRCADRVLRLQDSVGTMPPQKAPPRIAGPGRAPLRIAQEPTA